MTAAIYVRVSSRSQDLRSQESDLKKWDAANGPALWYQDKLTGTTMTRPGWDELWSDVLERKAGQIVVWRLDRLGRTASGLTALFDELRARGVGLVSLRDGLDLDTPAGRLMAGVLASVAQYETEVRSERQRAGIEAAKAAGKTFGRPKGTGRPISVTDERRALVLRLTSEGKGPAAAARLTGLGRSTVYRILEKGAESGGPPPA